MADLKSANFSAEHSEQQLKEDWTLINKEDSDSDSDTDSESDSESESDDEVISQSESESEDDSESEREIERSFPAQIGEVSSVQPGADPSPGSALAHPPSQEQESHSQEPGQQVDISNLSMKNGHGPAVLSQTHIPLRAPAPCAPPLAPVAINPKQPDVVGQAISVSSREAKCDVSSMSPAQRQQNRQFLTSRASLVVFLVFLAIGGLHAAFIVRHRLNHAATAAPDLPVHRSNPTPHVPPAPAPSQYSRSQGFDSARKRHSHEQSKPNPPPKEEQPPKHHQHHHHQQQQQPQHEYSWSSFLRDHAQPWFSNVAEKTFSKSSKLFHALEEKFETMKAKFHEHQHRHNWANWQRVEDMIGSHRAKWTGDYCNKWKECSQRSPSLMCRMNNYICSS